MSIDFPLKIDSAPSFTQAFTPVNVAILTSVGLHAFILGLALPNLQWSEPSQQTKKDQVNVIQLTDAEQSRLPDASPFSNSSAFFPSANSDLSNNIPNLPNNNSALNLPISQPPLPSNDYNYNSFPSQIPLPPSLPNLPAYPSNIPPLSNYGYGSLRRVPIATPPISLPPLPSFPTSSYRRSSEMPSLPGGTDLSRDTSRSRIPRPQFGELPPTRGTDFITRASQGTDNLVRNSTSNEPGLEANGEDTPSVQALQNDLKWRASLGNQKGSDIGAITLFGSYPRIACRNGTEATVVYNVDPSGSTTPVSLSRYPIFNQLAQKAFQSLRFTKPTRVRVNFNYDPKVCSSMTTAAPPLRNNTGSNIPPVPPTQSLPNNSPTVTPLNSATRQVPELPTLQRSGQTIPSGTPIQAPSLPSQPASQGKVGEDRPLLTTPSASPNPAGNNPPTTLQTTPRPQVPGTAPQTQPENPPSPTTTAPKPTAVGPVPGELRPGIVPKLNTSPKGTGALPETKRSRFFNNDGNNSRPTVRISPSSSAPSSPPGTPTEAQPTPQVSKPADGSTETSSLVAPASGKK